MSTLFTHFFDKINQISPLEHDFTEVLNTIALTPKTLYFRGKIPENMSKERPKTVAIVGSRHNTRYGEEVAYHLAYELARRGVIVVSGLAYGIDSIGHRGCLDAGGTTVAILGTSIDNIYPKKHLSLAREIVEKNGAIISEYAPGDNPITKYSFLERNRLISGLSDVVVVVEAAEKSGSLNTATHALAQGKEVFAVPGNITSPYSFFCINNCKICIHFYFLLPFFRKLCYYFLYPFNNMTSGYVVPYLVLAYYLGLIFYVSFQSVLMFPSTASVPPPRACRYSRRGKSR